MVLESSVAGTRVVSYDSIGSTNTEALLRARAGERGPLWVTATRQEAGRGRRGRTWVSEPGNLFASLLLTDPSPPERAPELSFVAALAIRDAVAEEAPRNEDHAAEQAPTIMFKWPNDLLLRGSKFAGILVEAERVGASLATVIGIGINCKHHPQNTSYPATDLSAEDFKALPDRLFKALAVSVSRRLAQWDRGANFSAIRAAWLARAAGLGQAIRVRIGARDLAGTMQTIDPEGRLVIVMADGRIETIGAGEVLALGPAFAAAAP